MSATAGQPQPPSHVLRPEELERFDRGSMTIYWVYGGRDVTRTITATGETFEHLSDRDRGATPAS